MSIVIHISDTKDGTVAISVEGEHTRQDTRAKKVFDLIIPAVRDHFKPKPKRIRRSVEFA